MKNRARIMVLSGALVLWAASPSEAAESPSVRLQKAIFAEETEGNLEAAIKIYEEIVEETGTNKPVAAQAHYRLGICRLKLGKRDEAAAAFRKLIGQFPEASDLVAKSRERLGELGQMVAAVVVRQVWSGKFAGGHRISRDGRILAFVDWENGHLVVRDLATGQSRPLNENISEGKLTHYPESCAISRDGKEIAYTYSGQGPIRQYGLSVVGVGGGNPRVLIGMQTNRWLEAEDWTPDGKSILLGYSENRGTSQHNGLLLLGVADGEVRNVVAGAENIWTPRLSPDGNYLAYGSGSTNGIIVLDLKSGNSRIAVEHMSKERFVDWAPSGSEILFTSERRGTADLWTLQIENGEAKGHPTLLKTDLGNLHWIGINQEGALFYHTYARDVKDLYVASVDFASGQMRNTPKPVKSRFMGFSDKEIWSGDGRYLFFRSGNNERLAQRFDAETGEVREFENSRSWGWQLGWWWASPESKSLLVSLMAAGKEANGLYLMNSESGELASLALNDADRKQAWHEPVRYAFNDDHVFYYRLHPPSKKVLVVKRDLTHGQETEYEVSFTTSGEHGWWGGPLLLPDKKSFLFSRKSLSEAAHVVVVQDLETRTEKELFSAKTPILIHSNPKGDRITLVFEDERAQPMYKLFSLENLEFKELRTVTVPEGFTRRGYLQRDARILLTKDVKSNRGVDREVWTLSLNTADLKKTEITLPEFQRWSLHEDAKRLVFQTVTPRQDEVWMMENLLPPAPQYGWRGGKGEQK